jgi:4-amino-4-deoxy-L-arabinose transferase-like glycosyltransferase
MKKLLPSFGLTPAVLWIWALCHLILWTVVPLLCNTCLPLDSIEAVMWGSQWQWGYNKHPPLSAWAAELFSSAFGDAGIYMLSQICIITAGLGIYRIARQFFNLTEKQALFAVLLLDTLYFTQFISYEFNVNYLQMPFWAWAWYCGFAAVQRRKIAYWIGLGACVALGALTKYIAVFMLVPLFIAWRQRGELKTALRTPGLYVAGITSILLFLPHLLWMRNHDWLTITYAMKRGNFSVPPTWWQHLTNPSEFLLIQLAILAPALLLGVICLRKSKEPSSKMPGAMGLALGAYLFFALLSLVTGMKTVAMWAAPMPLALGIWLVPRCRMDLFPRLFAGMIGFLWVLFLSAYIIVNGFGPMLQKRPHRVNYPAQAIAQLVDNQWKNNSGDPLQYIISDEFLGGIVNRYSSSRPAVMIHANLSHSTYLTEASVHEKGAVILWMKSKNQNDGRNLPLETVYPDIPKRFPQLQLKSDLIIPWPRKKGGMAGRYGIAIIPPATKKQTP